ncbi:MAG: lipoyl synthase [candidate division Zixibacteria bacterium]|nr:lipoyl synthase [candidate division Zixibacteria bacterium]
MVSMKPGKRKPEWLKVRAFGGKRFERTDRLLTEHRLSTVCRDANCPNRGECFEDGTATFLLMGPRCTRNCRFCDIPTGQPGPLDPGEPQRVAEAAALLQLDHVVVTSVTRDDLDDGGVKHFAATVTAIRKKLPSSSIEILTPDFQNVTGAVEIIVACHPDVFNHNVETVPRLYPHVRSGAKLETSLELLRQVAEKSSILTKSGLMVGLGETSDELCRLFSDLAHSGVSILTIGQYLAPSSDHYPVAEYIHPDQFVEMARLAREAGIKTVVSGPLVRSSYKAGEYINARA